MNDDAAHPPGDIVYVIDPAADPGPLPEIVVRANIENGHTVTGVVIDPADAQQLLYGTVTRPDGTFVGSYFPADIVRQSEWRVITADGTEYGAPSEGHAVIALTTQVATTRDRPEKTTPMTPHPRP